MGVTWSDLAQGACPVQALIKGRRGECLPAKGCAKGGNEWKEWQYVDWRQRRGEALSGEEAMHLQASPLSLPFAHSFPILSPTSIKRRQSPRSLNMPLAQLIMHS